MRDVSFQRCCDSRYFIILEYLFGWVWRYIIVCGSVRTYVCATLRINTTNFQKFSFIIIYENKEIVRANYNVESV